MVFYLAGLQNIEYSVYEAAKIDGANGWKTFWKIYSSASETDNYHDIYYVDQWYTAAV